MCLCDQLRNLVAKEQIGRRMILEPWFGISNYFRPATFLFVLGLVLLWSYFYY